MTKLAIISPCYNEEEVLEQSAARLTTLFDTLIAQGSLHADSKIYFVNDGSTDRTWEIIERLHKDNHYVCGINLTHNVGHQNAIMAGMMTVRRNFDAVITIDADLQDDLGAIAQMLAAHEAGSDVVYGVKVSRKADPVLKRMTAMAFYKLQRRMGVNSVYNHADFRLLSHKALAILSEFKERNLYLRGLIPLMGLPSATVDDAISERTAGTSKYTFSKMMNLALDGITSFSVKPIFAIFYLGIFFLFISLLIAIYVVHALIVHTAAPGWASLMLSTWLVGGFILMSIGIVGIYIGKIYNEVKQRPLYSVESVLE